MAFGIRLQVPMLVYCTQKTVGCVGGGGEGGIKKKRAAWKEGALEGATREGVMVTVWVCVVRFAITISRVKPGHPHSFFFLLYQLLLL